MCIRDRDLGFLVHADDDRLLRRCQVEPDHVADLGVQLGIGGELERLPLPGLQVIVAPRSPASKNSSRPSRSSSTAGTSGATPSCGPRPPMKSSPKPSPVKRLQTRDTRALVR